MLTLLGGLPLKNLWFEASLLSYRAAHVARAAHALHDQLATPKYWVANWNFTSHVWPLLGKFYPFYPPFPPKTKHLNLTCKHARVARSLWLVKGRWKPYAWGWFLCIIVTSISSGVREIEIWKVHQPVKITPASVVTVVTNMTYDLPEAYCSVFSFHLVGRLSA